MTGSKKDLTDPSADKAVFMAHAHKLETEAAERYAVLADQMEVHNNPELTALFRKLERIEKIHAETIAERADLDALSRLSPWDLQWPGFESPEAMDIGAVDYMMSAHRALSLALDGEKAAVRFFEALAQRAETPEIRTMAESFAEEEREHVRLMAEWLAKYPEADGEPAEDPDPPVMQE